MFHKSKITLEEVNSFSDILSGWLKLNLKEKGVFINKKRLNIISLFILQVHDDWSTIIKNYPNFKKDGIPIDALIYFNYYKNITGEMKKLPKPRFFKLKQFTFNLFNSFKVLITILRLSLKVNDYYQRTLANYLKKNNFYLIGNIPFSNLICFLRKNSKRKKLRSFLLRQELSYDTEILVKIIPNYLVELLDIYFYLAKYIKLREVHSWIYEIYICPILFIKCIFSEDLKFIGYQHGGVYALTTNIKFESELSTYDKFIYWGFEENNIIPFLFNKKNKCIKKRKSNNKNKLKNFRIICNRIDSYDFLPTNKLEIISRKILKLEYGVDLFLHPYNFYYSKSKLKNIDNRVKILNGTEADFFKADDIYLVSVFSTLFWELIYYRMNFVCYYASQINSQTDEMNRLLTLLKELNLIYNIEMLISNLDKYFYKKVLNSNLKLYEYLNLKFNLK